MVDEQAGQQSPATGLNDVKLHLVNSVAKANELMTWLGTVKTGIIGFDTETTGLNPERDHVRLVQVGDRDTGFAVPWERWGGVIEELLTRWDGDYVMHNAPYDRTMMRNEGVLIPINRIRDTRLYSHVRESDQSIALKQQTRRHIDGKAAMAQNRLDEYMTASGFGWHDIPIDPDPTHPQAMYWIYGAMDPVLTDRLREHHEPWVQAHCPRSYEVEMGAAWVVERMERRGARVDREYTGKQREQFAGYIGQLGDWCKSEYDVTAGSSQAVAERLIRDGVQLTQRTDSGAWKLDKFVLSATDHPLADAVLKRRQAQKLDSTYLRRFLEYSAHDGLLHPSINSVGGSNKSNAEAGGDMGVLTARMSMNSPNLQQLPRRGTSPLAEVVRNCIVAREGHRLVMCDFDQIEMRVLAHLSKDPGLITAFHSDEDFFVGVARQLFSDHSIVKSDPRRQVTKTAMYALVYGSGIETFSRSAGLSVQQGYEFMSKFKRQFPLAAALSEQVQRTALERAATGDEAYVQSPWTGRRHRLQDNKGYALLNHLIQGSAAELFKIKLLELDAAGLGEFMTLPVHDEVQLDVPIEDYEDVVRVVHGVMNDTKLLSVPLTSGIAAGERWGAKTDLSEEELLCMLN